MWHRSVAEAVIGSMRPLTVRSLAASKYTFWSLNELLNRILDLEEQIKNLGVEPMLVEMRKVQETNWDYEI